MKQKFLLLASVLVSFSVFASQQPQHDSDTLEEDSLQNAEKVQMLPSQTKNILNQEEDVTNEYAPQGALQKIRKKLSKNHRKRNCKKN